MRTRQVQRRVQADLPPTARRGELWSVCGKRIRSANEAIVHAATCCSVGRVVS
jgi:hypothetical protein